MKSDADQTHSLAQDAPQQGSGAGNVARPTAGSSSRLRRLGPRAARARVHELRAGRELSPQQLAMLKVTGRLIVHLENASNRLYRDGELTTEGEPKVLLSRVQDLARQIKGNLEDIFGADPSDPIGDVVRGAQ